MDKDNNIHGYIPYEDAIKNEKVVAMLNKARKKQKRKNKIGKGIAISCFVAAILIIIIYYIYRTCRAAFQLKMLVGDFKENPIRMLILILLSVVVTFLLYKAKKGTEDKYKKIREEKANGKNSDENSAR